MKFSYNERHDYLELSAYKLDVKIFFYNGEVSYIDIDGHEFTPGTDSLYGIIVKAPTGKRGLGDIWYTLHDLQEVMNEAERQYDGIIREVQADQAAEARMERELSSPQATGRI